MKALHAAGCQAPGAPRLPARVLALAVALGAASPVGADLIRLSLYDKPAQSELVVRGSVQRGDLRLAEVVVEEVLKGLYDRPALLVVFRLDNFTRKAWEDKVAFRNGEPVLLFLRPFEKESGEQPFADRFTLVRGTQGKVELPPEGSGAILAAVRRFIRVQSQTDIDQIAQDLRAFLSDPNPLVVEAGLEEVQRLRLGLPQTAPALLPILAHPVADFRRGALRVLAQIFEDRHLWPAALDNEDHVVTRLLGCAREDGEPAVRSEAVRTLEARGKRDILAALEQIARNDPTQQVRFQAQLAAYGLSRSGDAPVPARR